MFEETIIVTQQIVISFNCPEAREAALSKIQLEGTDWMAFSHGTIRNEPLQYRASKTKEISIERGTINPSK